jgi:uncharacterized membrane protein
MELILIMVLTLLVVQLVLFTSGGLGIVLGVLFLLFFPGYTLIAALFPRKDSFNAVERVVLSFALSIAVVPLIGLVLNYTPWGIKLAPITVSVAIFIFATSIIALFRRRSLPEGERFEPRFHMKLPQWKKQTRLDKALSAILILSILGAIGALVYVVALPRAEEPFTEFYMLGPEGMAEDYPQELVLGEQAEVTLGIINHEHQDDDYNIEVKLDGENVQGIGPISLAHEEEWQEKLTLVPAKAGEDQKVEFLLYKGEGSEPYLILWLWLDVKG